MPIDPNQVRSDAYQHARRRLARAGFCGPTLADQVSAVLSALRNERRRTLQAVERELYDPADTHERVLIPVPVIRRVLVDLDETDLADL